MGVTPSDDEGADIDDVLSFNKMASLSPRTARDGYHTAAHRLSKMRDTLSRFEGQGTPPDAAQAGGAAAGPQKPCATSFSPVGIDC